MAGTQTERKFSTEPPNPYRLPQLPRHAMIAPLLLRPAMTRFCLLLGFAVLPTAAAASAPVALVIGIANYTAMPPLPACAASAGLVARRFSEAGAAVTNLTDLSNGALDAAVAGFANRAAAAPNSPAVLYFCGYGAALDNRDFLLPATANITAPTDLLSQGILARSVLASSLSGRKAPAYLILDLVRDPALTLAPVTGTWARGSGIAGVGLMVVTETRPPSAPTPLAAAITPALLASPAGTKPLAVIAAALPTSSGTSVAAVQDAAPPPQAAPGGVPPPAPTPAGLSPAALPDVPGSAATALPADAAMTTADRRRIQIALASLGYYDGRLDGIFGPDSRAAIRRWQHEVSAQMTGTLTAAQATRLASGHP